MGGYSKEDFEFGELLCLIKTTIDKIRAPTMLIGYEDLSKLQTKIMGIKALIKKWIGFEVVIGYLDSIESIVEEYLATKRPVTPVELNDKQRLVELYTNMRTEIIKTYERT